jgi:hypothetical protein
MGLLCALQSVQPAIHDADPVIFLGAPEIEKALLECVGFLQSAQTQPSGKYFSVEVFQNKLNQLFIRYAEESSEGLITPDSLKNYKIYDKAFFNEQLGLVLKKLIKNFRLQLVALKQRGYGIFVYEGLDWWIDKCNTEEGRILLFTEESATIRVNQSELMGLQSERGSPEDELFQPVFLITLKDAPLSRFDHMIGKHLHENLFSLRDALSDAGEVTPHLVKREASLRVKKHVGMICALSFIFLVLASVVAHISMTGATA